MKSYPYVMMPTWSVMKIQINLQATYEILNCVSDILTQWHKVLKKNLYSD